MNNRGRLLAIAVGALVLAGLIAVLHARKGEQQDKGDKRETDRPAATAEAPQEAAPAEPAAPPARGPVAAAPNVAPDAGAPSARAQAMVARMNEAVLMARLREVARTDPAQAIELARAGNERFPDSPDAPERTSILIHALVTEDKLSEGRAEAEYMVNHYPDSAWVREIEGFTGAHRHRNIRVNDAGQIEYY